MKWLLLLLIIAGVAGYFTNPTEAQHRTAANALLHEQASDAGNNFDIGGLLETGVASLTQNGAYQNFYVGSEYTLDSNGHPYVQCYGAFTKVMCNRTTQGNAQPSPNP